MALEKIIIQSSSNYSFFTVFRYSFSPESIFASFYNRNYATIGKSRPLLPVSGHAQIIDL
jgi:hypothetical protein